MGYFTNFPKVSLPSFADNRSSSLDFVNSTNLFKRGKIREEIIGSIAAFERYSINGDDRPDNVAFRVYGDSSLDWVILISNNILNVRDEWPMNQYDFKRYIDNKYSTSLLTQIHHYESKEVRNSKGLLLQQSGIWVDADHSFSWSENGKKYTQTGTTSVSNLQFEEDRNNKKRSINVVRSNYLEVIKEDMRELLTYTDSSQYVNRKLKKGSNLRILSPR
tara:strand:- start:1507 stop:2163 length:657 start_codon:yes stop_codon:yes gene_type:complete